MRLDVYLKDDKKRHFDVEMQVAETEIFRRSRYYHSQIDMELLGTGIDYEELPESYVIFICDYDPIGLKKYKYTRHQGIKEDSNYIYDDGSHTVFLSTAGENDDEVSQDLVNFLKYVGAELEESQKDYHDEFVEQLQQSVKKIKFDREMGRRYMLLEELMKDEYKAGKEEGLAEGKEIGLAEGKELGLAEGKELGLVEGKELGLTEGQEKALNNLLENTIDMLVEKGFSVSESLRERILSIEFMEKAVKCIAIAAMSDSLQSFDNELKKIGY